MKILLAASTSNDPLQGVSGVMHSLSKEFSKAGHEVRLRFQSTPGRLHGMTFGLQLARSADLRWADIVDVHAVDAWPLCALPRRQVVVARSHGLEVVVHRGVVAASARGEIHLGPLYRFYRGSLRLAFERSAVRSSDATLVLNQADRDICLSEMGGDPARVHLVRNGFPPEFLSIPHSPGNGVVFVGSWLARKGKDYLVRVIDALLEADPDQSILLAGTGVPDHEVLQEFSPRSRDRLVVVSKFQRQDLPRMLEGKGIILMASRSEGSPLSLMESMACGVAPVAMAIPGVVEVIEDGRSGILVPPGNVQEMLESVLALRRDPSRLSDLRQGARDRVRHAGWDRIATDQLSLYSTLLAKRRGTPT